MARGVDADTVEEYLDRIGEPFSSALRVVRDRIEAILPDAEQVISYRCPSSASAGAGAASSASSAFRPRRRSAAHC